MPVVICMVRHASETFDMRNPSYLFLSRHNIYYFRFPLSQITSGSIDNKYIKLSLQTRQPREALALATMMRAKILRLSNLGIFEMLTYKQCVDMLKDFFEERLELVQQRGKDKVISVEQIEANERALAEYEEDVRKHQSGINTLYQAAEIDDEHFNKIREKNNLSSEHDLQMLRKVINEIGVETYADFFRSLLKIKKGYELDDNQSLKPVNNNLNAISFDDAFSKYVEEKSRVEAWSIRAKAEREDCFEYLKEALPKTTRIDAVGKKEAREVKDMLLSTPKNRNKIAETRGKNLSEQIATKKEKGIEGLSVGSINKYLQTYSGLFKWASDNGYTESNPFEGLGLKENKSKAKEPKRQAFTKAEIKSLLNELDKKGTFSFILITINVLRE